MNIPDQHKPEPTGLLNRIISCYFWITIFLIPGIFFPLMLAIWILTFWFDRRLIILHQCTCYLSDLTLSANPYWRITVEGKEKINKDHIYVMVSNHQSGADIMALFKTHLTFKWVAKKSLFFLPFIGWTMFLDRYIPIQRSRGRSKLRMMDKSIQSIKEGNSIMMFPEGTRSADGNLQPFKSGAFRAAYVTESDILPIAIRGTFHAIRKGSLIINTNCDIKTLILDPIPFDAYKNMQSNEVAQLVHDKILREIRK